MVTAPHLALQKGASGITLIGIVSRDVTAFKIQTMIKVLMVDQTVIAVNYMYLYVTIIGTM